MVDTGSISFAGERPKALLRFARWADRAAIVAVWYRRWRSRRELARLDPVLLRDLGITRDQALDEAGKRFWRV